MEIPKDYIKIIYLGVKTIEHPDHYLDYLDNLLKGFISPTMGIRDYSIDFELIKPLDKNTLDSLLDFDGLDCLDNVSYIPYEKNESVDEFIKNEFEGESDKLKYLKFLMKYMPEKPILEKLSNIKFNIIKCSSLRVKS